MIDFIKRLLRRPLKCEVCGTTKDLRCAPLMTGDKFGKLTKHPVCLECIRAWYEYGCTTPESILQQRGLKP